MSVELRRQMTKGGRRWTVLRTVLDFIDADKWRVVVEEGHWQDGQIRFRMKKYQPSGKFYFCEGITLTPAAWIAVQGVRP